MPPVGLHNWYIYTVCTLYSILHLMHVCTKYSELYVLLSCDVMHVYKIFRTYSTGMSCCHDVDESVECAGVGSQLSRVCGCLPPGTRHELDSSQGMHTRPTLYYRVQTKSKININSWNKPPCVAAYRLEPDMSRTPAKGCTVHTSLTFTMVQT